MNILVVGGCGYVGGSVINILKDRKKKFINYDNLLYEDYYLEENNFQFGDVRDQKLLKKKIIGQGWQFTIKMKSGLGKTKKLE